MGNSTSTHQRFGEGAIRKVRDRRDEHPSLWTTLASVSRKLGITPKTLREWFRCYEIDAGNKEGLNSDERARLKALEKENKELTRANRYFAMP